jgi:hypothetical protein
VLALLFFAAGAPAAESRAAELLRTPMEQAVAQGSLLSGVAAVRRNGEVEIVSVGAIEHGGDAAPGRRTPYQIGSITKVFTNLLLAELVAAGALPRTRRSANCCRVPPFSRTRRSVGPGCWNLPPTRAGCRVCRRTSRLPIRAIPTSTTAPTT